MQVQVDISETGGAPVAAVPAAGKPARYQTAVFDQSGKDADARIAHIVSANLRNQPHSNLKAK